MAPTLAEGYQVPTETPDTVIIMFYVTKSNHLPSGKDMNHVPGDPVPALLTNKLSQEEWDTLLSDCRKLNSCWKTVKDSDLCCLFSCFFDCCFNSPEEETKKKWSDILEQKGFFIELQEWDGSDYMKMTRSVCESGDRIEYFLLSPDNNYQDKDGAQEQPSQQAMDDTVAGS